MLRTFSLCVCVLCAVVVCVCVCVFFFPIRVCVSCVCCVRSLCVRVIVCVCDRVCVLLWVWSSPSNLMHYVYVIATDSLQPMCLAPSNLMHYAHMFHRKKTFTFAILFDVGNGRDKFACLLYSSCTVRPAEQYSAINYHKRRPCTRRPSIHPRFQQVCKQRVTESGREE